MSQEKIYFGNNYEFVIDKEIGIRRIVDLLKTSYKVGKVEDEDIYLIKTKSETNKNELK